MPVTKKVKTSSATEKVQSQVDYKIYAEDLEDEEEGSEEKPIKSNKKKEPDKAQSDKKEYESALKDLLLRLGSLKPDDLKQLTFMSLKIRDPLAKGMAYYDSTIPTIESQCTELLDWYIKKCWSDIDRYEEYIKELKDKEEKAKTAGKATTPVVSKMAVLKKKTFSEMIFGSKKARVTPQLEAFDVNVRLDELKQRMIELNKLKGETTLVDTDKMYFKTWAYNYLLNCRSQSGDDNLLKMMVMLADGQIVNKSDSGGLDGSKVFLR